MIIPTHLEILKKQFNIIQHLLMKASRSNDCLAQARLGVKLKKLNHEIQEIEFNEDRSASFSTKPRKERAEKKQEIGI